MEKNLQPEKKNWLTALIQSRTTALATIGGTLVGVHEVFEILRSDPAKTLAIIEKWGPVFVIVFFLVWILGRAMDRQGDISAQNASALQQMAEAVTKIASKDDVAEQRTQLLVEFAATEAKNTRTTLDLQNSALDRIEKSQLAHDEIHKQITEALKKLSSTIPVEKDGNKQ